MAENSSSHELRICNINVPEDVDPNDEEAIKAYFLSIGILDSVRTDSDGNQRWIVNKEAYEEAVRAGIVQNEAELDSDEWRQVQSLGCRNFGNSQCGWKLFAGQFEKELRMGYNMEELMKILSVCGHLIKYYRITYEVYDAKYEKMCFTLIPTKCKNMVTINVNSTPTHYASGAFNMSENWKDLKLIMFQYLTKSTKSDIYKLLEKNKHLEFLDLVFGKECIKTDKFFNYIPDTIEGLRLDMRYVDEVKFEYYISAFKRFTSLRTLVYNCQNLGNKLAMAFESLTSLTVLRLRIFENCESDRTIDHIASLVNLEILILMDNDCLQDNNLIAIINGCKKLLGLDISGCKNITDKGIAHLAKLTESAVVHIRGIDGISSETISNLSTTLQISKCDINEQELMQKVSSLKTFKLTKIMCEMWKSQFENDE